MHGLERAWWVLAREQMPFKVFKNTPSSTLNTENTVCMILQILFVDIVKGKFHRSLKLTVTTK